MEKRHGVWGEKGVFERVSLGKKSAAGGAERAVSNGRQTHGESGRVGEAARMGKLPMTHGEANGDDGSEDGVGALPQKNGGANGEEQV